MKNQYFGDVGDYGKYGLLRFLAKNKINIAVNWYLTPDDGSNDGKHISYLKKDDMRKYDEELFDILKGMINANQRNVDSFAMKRVIPNAIYYNQILHDQGNMRAEKRAYREKWHNEALSVCGEADLVFLDPDNGACEKEPASAKASIKYCYADEIADYYEAGKNVVYYCLKGRRTDEQWKHAKLLMQRRLPDARLAIITFHKGTSPSYIFVLHSDSFRRYTELIKEFLQKWSRIFTEDKHIKE